MRRMTGRHAARVRWATSVVATVVALSLGLAGCGSSSYRYIKSSDDSAYQAEQATLLTLADDRDKVVAKLKHVLSVAAHSRGLRHGEVRKGLALVSNLLQRADALAGS